MRVLVSLNFENKTRTKMVMNDNHEIRLLIQRDCFHVTFDVKVFNDLTREEIRNRDFCELL